MGEVFVFEYYGITGICYYFEVHLDFFFYMFYGGEWIEYPLYRSSLEEKYRCGDYGDVLIGKKELLVPRSFLEKDASIVIEKLFEVNTLPLFDENAVKKGRSIIDKRILDYADKLRKTELNEREERIYEQLLAWLESQPRKKEKKGKKKRFRFF